MVLAHRNRELVRNGEKPTEEQIMEEERAVIAVELARSKLLAAISCLGR